MRLPALRMLLPFVAGIVLCDWSLAPPPWWLVLAAVSGAALAAVSGAALVWPPLRSLAELMLGVALGGLALALRLHAPIPELAPDAPSASVQLLEVPRRSGPLCRVVVWIFGAQPGRALLRTSDELCDLLPGQRARARLELGALAVARNPGGRSSERDWRRRGVRRVARIVDGLQAPVVTPRGLRGWLEEARRTVADRVDPERGGGRAGAVLRAVVAGQRDRIDPELRSVFTRTGTAHLLAVSGLHVACVFTSVSIAVAWLLGLAPWAGWVRHSRHAGIFAGVATASAYAALSGLGVPALRAAAMAAAGTWAVLSGRPAASANALGLAALLVLAVDPAALFDAGFALSFSAVSGILLWRPPARGISALIHVTVAAGLATAPWVAALGLPLPASGVLANALAVPVFGFIVVPLGLFAGVVGSFVPWVAVWGVTVCAAAVEITLRALAGLAAPDLLAATSRPVVLAGAFAVCGFALRCFWLQRRRGWLLVSGFASVTALLASMQSGNKSLADPELLFLDVGHGDAVLVRSLDRAGLIDAGPRLGSFDAGARVVAPALRALGVRRLDVLVVTHSDLDHTGGARSILERVEVGELWLTARTAEHREGRELRRAAARRGVPVRIVARGERAQLGELAVEALWPPPESSPATPNAASLVLRVEGAGSCALLPGDIPASVERELAAKLRPCPLLKLAHHGSRSSTDPRLVERLQPSLAVASAGRRRHGPLPHPTVRARLAMHDVTIYETREHGAVSVRFTPHGLVAAPFLP